MRFRRPRRNMALWARVVQAIHGQHHGRDQAGDIAGDKAQGAVGAQRQHIQQRRRQHGQERRPWHACASRQSGACLRRQVGVGALAQFAAEGGIARRLEAQRRQGRQLPSCARPSPRRPPQAARAIEAMHQQQRPRTPCPRRRARHTSTGTAAAWPGRWRPRPCAPQRRASDRPPSASVPAKISANSDRLLRGGQRRFMVDVIDHQAKQDHAADADDTARARERCRATASGESARAAI